MSFLFGRGDRETKEEVSREGEGAEVQIRKYRTNDRKAVLAIASESFEGVCLDENIEEKFGKVGSPWREHKRDAVDYDLSNHPSSAFVALIDGEVVGFACNRLYNSRSLGHVANLAVTEQYQGEGIGKALMKASLDYFRQMGLKYARIETLEQNDKGVKFYPGLGFEEVGRQVFYFKEL